MVKRKFGGKVRSLRAAAMVNEVVCKRVAHYLCCLLQEHELGIDPLFWQAKKDETRVLAV